MAASLTVTVVVSPALQSAVEGRPRLLLGLPPGAGLGELWETLLKLYPKLLARIANERTASPGLNAFFEGELPWEVESGRGASRRGVRLFLLAPYPHAPPERLG